MITLEIIGGDMQAVVVSMAAGDEVRAEAGALCAIGDWVGGDS
jgi:hypothetical protein